MSLYLTDTNTCVYIYLIPVACNPVCLYMLLYTHQYLCYKSVTSSLTLHCFKMSLYHFQTWHSLSRSEWLWPCLQIVTLLCLNMLHMRNKLNLTWWPTPESLPSLGDRGRQNCVSSMTMWVMYPVLGQPMRASLFSSLKFQDTKILKTLKFNLLIVDKPTLQFLICISCTFIFNISKFINTLQCTIKFSILFTLVSVNFLEWMIQYYI